MTADLVEPLTASFQYSFVEVCYACSSTLCPYFRSPESYAVFCTAQHVLASQDGKQSCRAPIRHLRLIRGGGDGRDAAVLDKAPWPDILSIEAVHGSLYAVQEALVNANVLLELDVELLFPEPFGDLVPLNAPFANCLRKLVLRKCPSEMIAGLAEVLCTGALPQLSELVLVGSPKGEAACAKGLGHYMTRPQLHLDSDPDLPQAMAAETLASAIRERQSINSIVLDSVAPLCRPDGIDVLMRISARPGLRCLHLVNSLSLGHRPMTKILYALLCNSPLLECLRLAPAPLCTAAFEEAVVVGAAIAGVLVNLRSLISLRLTWCGLGDEGALAIANGIEAQIGKDVLSITPGMSIRARIIDLSHNSFAGSAIRLVQVIAHCAPKLEQLVLDGNDVDTTLLEETSRRIRKIGRAHV